MSCSSTLKPKDVSNEMKRNLQESSCVASNIETSRKAVNGGQSIGIVISSRLKAKAKIVGDLLICTLNSDIPFS